MSSQIIRFPYFCKECEFIRKGSSKKCASNACVLITFACHSRLTIISSRLMNLLFFCFLRSRGGSFNALMTRAAAEGTTEICACLFCTISCTVIFRPFQSPVALAMSSPTFLGDYSTKKLAQYSFAILNQDLLTSATFK